MAGWITPSGPGFPVCCHSSVPHLAPFPSLGYVVAVRRRWIETPLAGWTLNPWLSFLAYWTFDAGSSLGITRHLPHLLDFHLHGLVALGPKRLRSSVWT